MTLYVSFYNYFKNGKIILFTCIPAHSEATILVLLPNMLLLIVSDVVAIFTHSCIFRIMPKEQINAKSDFYYQKLLFNSKTRYFLRLAIKTFVQKKRYVMLPITATFCIT